MPPSSACHGRRMLTGRASRQSCLRRAAIAFVGTLAIWIGPLSVLPEFCISLFKEELPNWRAANGEAVGLVWPGGQGETPAYDVIDIQMPALVKGRLGVNIVTEQRKVSRVLYKEAWNAGWRVGDEILEVNGKVVANNRAVRAAVKKAIAAHVKSGEPLRFKVRRWGAKNISRGMVRMSTERGLDHLVPMLDLTMGLLGDYPVVLFIEGELGTPKTRQSASAVKLLDDMGIAFKALDCADEKLNPGVRDVVEKLSNGDSSLPQLFVGGHHVGDLSTIRRLHRRNELRPKLDAAISDTVAVRVG